MCLEPRAGFSILGGHQNQLDRSGDHCHVEVRFLGPTLKTKDRVESVGPAWRLGDPEASQS